MLEHLILINKMLKYFLYDREWVYIPKSTLDNVTKNKQIKITEDSTGYTVSLEDKK